MALLVSSWSDLRNEVQSVPDDYVVPPAPERRLGSDFHSVCKEIPVINLQNDRSEIVKQILKASQEFGVFQVINHGVSEKVMEDMRVLYDEFFNMPVEEKLSVNSDTYGDPMLFTSGYNNYAEEDTHYLRETLKHPCHPLEEHNLSWPNKPPRYREEVGRYAVEVRKMAFKIIDMMREGLGLTERYLDGVGQYQVMVAKHYPEGPDPSVTMRMRGHTDPNLITFLQEDRCGLQISKDAIPTHFPSFDICSPIPNAFVVVLGYQFQVISNDVVKSVEHHWGKISTSSQSAISTFFGPNPTHSVVIEPAAELVTSSRPQMFKSYLYKNFLDNYMSMVRKSVDGTPLDPYRF